MAFDVKGALKDGYSPAEIADYLASKSNFDVAAARKDGYTDDEILGHLSSRVNAPKAAPVEEAPAAPAAARAPAPTPAPAPAKPADTRGVLQKVKDFVTPEYKSVLDTAAPPTAQEQQAEIDKRLSYGAGPVSKGTVAQADLVRSGITRTEDERVKQVAQEMDLRGEESIGGLIERAKRPENVAAARDAKAEEFRTAGQWAFDTLVSAPAQFGASFLSLPVNIIAPSSAIGETLRKAQKDFKDLESDQLKARQARMAARVNNEEGFINQYATVVGELVSSPSMALQETVKQAGYFLGVLGLAKAGSAAAGGLVSLAGRASPTLALGEAISGGAIQTAARAAGATGGGATASVIMAGGDAAGSTYEALTDPNKTPLKEWQKNEDYQRLTAGGMSSKDAIKEIATTKARIAAAIVAPLGLFGYAGAEAAIVSRGIAKSLNQRLATQSGAKIFGKELVGENIEEMGTQLGGNVVTQTVNPNQDLLEGVAEAGATATVTSGPFAALAARNEYKQVLAGQPGGAQFAGSDQIARNLLSPQTYDARLISPLETADPSRILQSTSVDDAVTSANELAGSLEITPGPIAPAPLGAIDTLGRIEPTFDPNAPLPAIDTMQALTLPEPSVATEQQFGLDKLRLNAPRPQKIQGVAVSQLSDDQLQTIAADESVPAITRRGASVELTARQAEVSGTTPATGLTNAPSVPLANAPTDQNAGIIADKTLTLPESEMSGAAIAPVGGESAAAGARATAQAAIDRWATSNGVESPAIFNASPANLDSAVNEIAQALNSQFSGRVYSYNDDRSNAINGVAIGGTAFINTANVDTNVARTGLHEFHHTIEQLAKLETNQGLTNTPAQQYVASMDGVFDDMTDAGKRAYLENFLLKEELDAIADPVAREQRLQEAMAGKTIRSEMTADFLGNRATDKKFWEDVAAADPQGFKGFVDKWIKIIDNLIDALKGTATQSGKESAKVDTYLRDLNKAKAIARDALVAYNKGIKNGSINVATGQDVSGPTASARQLAGGDGRGEAPEYGTAREGAISVLARHYSTEARTSLNGAYYGTGLKGAERDRLDSSPDPRLKNRVYFYVDQGSGVRPESGVGGIAHEVRLNNIYDPETQILPVKGNFNAFESAVINGGFDGYIAPFGNNQAAVVLLGPRHSAVPVRSLGRVAGAPAPIPAEPTTLKKGLLSKELATIEASRVPGARVAAGNLEIPVASRDAANTELERIGSNVRFSEKQAEPVEEKPTDLGTFRDVADALGLSKEQYDASVLGLMTGKTKSAAFDAPLVGGIPETVQWLDQRYRDSGMPTLNLNKAEDRSTLAHMLAAEAIGAIRSAGNAVEWYDETVAKTLRVMAVKYPELNTDPDARNAFLMAVAISSQTMNVEDNLRYASNQYEAFREALRKTGTGAFPEVGTGKSAPAMAKNFALANSLLKDLGAADLRRFLQTTLTKRELEGMGFRIGGESMDESVLGSAVFGPKIGFGFYSNLTGNFEPVTMDMWFMRTIGRLSGTLPAFDEVLFPKQVAKLRAALAETGSSAEGVYAADFSPEDVAAAQQTDEGAIALARKVFSLHNRQFIKERAKFDAGTRKKTALVGASGAILKSADKPTDAPASGGERQRLRSVVREMVDLVEEQIGKRVPPAALQALIWYPEQELYKKLGVKLRVTSQDYAGAAQSLLKKEGFDAKRINAAAKSGSGSARQVAGKQNAGATGPVGGAGQRLGPFQGQERSDLIRTRTEKTLDSRANATPLVDLFTKLEGRGLAKTNVESVIARRSDAAQIQYMQDNFLDILDELDTAGLVEINCK